LQFIVTIWLSVCKWSFGSSFYYSIKPMHRHYPGTIFRSLSHRGLNQQGLAQQMVMGGELILVVQW